MLQHWVGRVNEVTKLLVGICCGCGSGLAFEREPEREGGEQGVRMTARVNHAYRPAPITTRE